MTENIVIHCFYSRNRRSGRTVYIRHTRPLFKDCHSGKTTRGTMKTGTMNTLKKSDNFKFIIVGILTSVLVFYFKDLSLALGKTGRISLIFSVWVPVIALSFFIFIGVIQINEK